MERVERANRSNLIRSNKGEYWYLRKDRAFWFNGEYYKQINILNLKDALFNEQRGFLKMETTYKRVLNLLSKYDALNPTVLYDNNDTGDTNGDAEFKV